jgi:pimeloyl-ACP methyl ester carboxylesterase
LAIVLAVLTFLIVFEYGYSLLVLSWPRQVTIVEYPGLRNLRTSIVLPGFSNPSRYLGQGMQRILGSYGPMLVLHHATTVNFDRIYDAIMVKLDELNSPRELTIYGHSMGGQLGEQFLERYEREGSIYGPVRELFLDCSPGSARSLPAPEWLKSFLRGAFKIYWGGPLLALIVALGNLVSRFKVPAPLSKGADAMLYRHYARGLMWFNNRAWVAQMRYMLNYKLPAKPVATSARVIYIGAKDPARDGLVRQRVSIPEWQQVHPGLNVILDDAVGHAWPMEQPEAYERIVRGVIAPTAAV